MKKLFSILLMVMLAAALAVTAFAADPAVKVETTDTNVTVGSTFDVTVSISNNPGFESGKLTFSYNANVLKLTELQNGLFAGSVNVTGGIVNHFSSSPVTGDGVLCTATFEVVGTGSTSVTVVMEDMMSNAVDASSAFTPGVTPVTVTASCNHVWTNGHCDNCDADCSHTGGTATCKDRAECSECGMKYGELAGHSYMAETVKEDALKSVATCTTAAVYYKSCSVCGHVEKAATTPTFTSGKSLDHDWGVWTESKAATCTDKGEESRSCKRNCGVEPQTRETDALGHDWGAWTESKAATCTDKGEESRSCKRDCGVEPQTRETDALDHDWGAWTESKAATCTDKGEESRSCKRNCGVEPQTRETDALGHDWGAWTESKAATCTDKGEESRSCKRDCGVEPQTRETDALGHGQWIDYKVVTEATCGADGVAQGECGLCHNVFDDIVIPATGEHSWDEGEVTREATTEAEGEKTFTCTVCGKTRTEPIAKLAPVATAKPAAKPHSPKTGDESHLVVWAAALLLACGGTAVVIARKKHN